MRENKEKKRKEKKEKKRKKRNNMYSGNNTSLKGEKFGTLCVEKLISPPQDKRQPTPLHSLFKMRILSERSCRAIVREAEAVSSQLGWETKRHKHFPTVDVPLRDLPASSARVQSVFKATVFSFLANAYEIRKPHTFTLGDAFVVKYDAEVRTGRPI